MGVSAKPRKGRQILAANMRARRQELEMSQERLAELADLHRTYVSSVECCRRNIGIDGAERIATALRLTLAELFSAR
jgi:transcriptional regulator with XRE-family HTH domain